MINISFVALVTSDCLTFGIICVYYFRLTMEGVIWFWFKQLVMGLLALGWIYNQAQTIHHRLSVGHRVPPTFPPSILCPEIVIPPNCDEDISTLPCTLTTAPTILPHCNETTFAPCILQERNQSALSNDSGAGDVGDSVPLIELCANLSLPSTTEVPVLTTTTQVIFNLFMV